jgi:hypothetical protein
MKKKIILFAAIVMLLGFAAWMVMDLLHNDKLPEQNPYAYDLKSLGPPDSLPRFKELGPVKPALAEISGIAADHQGRIYVCGKGGAEIFDSAGKEMQRFTIPGSAGCIALLPDGNLLLGMTDHVEQWSPAGMRMAEWKPADTSSVITSIAANASFVYVADAGKKIVYQYDHKGNLLSRIGEKDPERKIPGFIVPSPFFDVGISPSGDLWVANPGRYELEKYSPEGSLLSHWGESSMALEGFAGCCNPSHFAFLSDGSFVTSEKGIVRVKICYPDGRFRYLVAGPESFEEGTKGLDLAVDCRGRILVLDPYKHLVHIFIPAEKH